MDSMLINLLTSGFFAANASTSLGCTEQNVNNQTLTQVKQLYVHISFCLIGNPAMTKSAQW